MHELDENESFQHAGWHLWRCICGHAVNDYDTERLEKRWSKHLARPHESPTGVAHDIFFT